MAKIDQQYALLARGIMNQGYRYKTDNRPQDCIQISSVNLEIDLEEFPLITTKKMFTKGIVEELLWFLRGDTNVKSLNEKGVHIWDQDAENFGKDGDVGRNYGAQWRDWTGVKMFNTGGEDYLATYGIDQIENLIIDLRKLNPINRRNLVTAWNPAQLNQTALPPCHWAWEVIPRPMTYTMRIDKSGKDLVYLHGLWQSMVGTNKEASAEAKLLLDEELKEVPFYGFVLKWHQRSVDTFLGLPFNIASYGVLSAMIGTFTNVVPLSLIGDLSNVHFYEPHVELVKQQLKNNPALHKGCQLKFSEGYYIGVELYLKNEISFTEFIKGLTHEDFIFEGYTSFESIKGDMYAPIK
jgi:thymidylate synthase